MNARPLAFVVLSLAALGVSSAAPPRTIDPRPYAYTVTKLYGINRVPIAAGSHAWELWDALGWPVRRASPTVSLYDINRSFQPNLQARQGCDILVVTLDDHGQIADLKVVNRSAARIIVACAAAGRPVPFAAPPEDSKAFVTR